MYLMRMCGEKRRSWGVIPSRPHGSALSFVLHLCRPDGCGLRSKATPSPFFSPFSLLHCDISAQVMRLVNSQPILSNLQRDEGIGITFVSFPLHILFWKRDDGKWDVLSSSTPLQGKRSHSSAAYPRKTRAQRKEEAHKTAQATALAQTER